MFFCVPDPDQKSSGVRSRFYNQWSRIRILVFVTDELGFGSPSIRIPNRMTIDLRNGSGHDTNLDPLNYGEADDRNLDPDQQLDPNLTIDMI